MDVVSLLQCCHLVVLMCGVCGIELSRLCDKLARKVDVEVK